MNTPQDDNEQMEYLRQHAERRKEKIIARRKSFRQLKVKVQKFFHLNTRG